MRVVAAYCRRPDGRFLVTQRPEGGPMGGLWEFPGGKVEPGEGDRAALKREIGEELGVDCRVTDRVFAIIHEYRGFTLDFRVYACHLLGEPQKIEVADLRWITSEELRGLSFPPADAALVESLLHGHALGADRVDRRKLKKRPRPITIE
ncbi:MAG: (deoxy)nucleoside triphosphate pyrophosphohydrolase [Deltaproteobacteria bacterium]|nr:(deoxy)nucleoside triphosphate pyrophosphohydrolase [Deltaproteobacteria bacterium]